MHLPERNDLPINLLAGCFNNTSATYKFYWFISILQSIENGKDGVDKRELFARMISNAWYTVNYFHISFGKQDQLQRAIETIKESEALKIDDDLNTVYNKLIQTQNRKTLSQIQYFDRQVPHWFLSPWFPGMTKQQIYQHSQVYTNNCPYALFDARIVINVLWLDYFRANAKVLKDFCYWNLVMFLQSKNPNVPDIPNKLIKPAIRNSLNRQRNDFWNIVFREKGSVRCIYTGEELTIGNYAVEHFIPYSFVSHDLIWNLIPANQSFNSTKSNKLPRLEVYFDPFYDLQKEAIDIVRFVNPKNKFLEDYLSIFPDLEEIKNLPDSFTRKKFIDRIQPLITIASNNGFEFLP